MAVFTFLEAQMARFVYIFIYVFFILLTYLTFLSSQFLTVACKFFPVATQLFTVPFHLLVVTFPLTVSTHYIHKSAQIFAVSTKLFAAVLGITLLKVTGVILPLLFSLLYSTQACRYSTHYSTQKLITLLKK